MNCLRLVGRIGPPPALLCPWLLQRVSRREFFGSSVVAGLVPLVGLSPARAESDEILIVDGWMLRASDLEQLPER